MPEEFKIRENSSIAGAKPYAVDMFQQKKVTRFNPEHAYPQGCTDYDRWQTAEVHNPSLPGRKYNLPCTHFSRRVCTT